MEEPVINHGRAVAFFRKHDNISVEELAKEMGISTSDLETLEKQPEWEDEILHKAAMALDRPFDVLKTFEPAMFEKLGPVTVNHNTFNDESSMSKGEGCQVAGGHNSGEMNINTFNKIIDLYDSTIKYLKDVITRQQQEIDKLKSN